ncbi:hypothetical protein [Synechocystis sp. PCC 7509]|uniref:hypothetical protein n=1 Tax=Synechocystis sp. PCC 7509 TaxID=927677 RepID=UPI0002ACAEE2|nr:hypothetical protein [Synechocystis sp. PCC 7509]
MKLSESENCPKCTSVLPLRYATGRIVCKKCGWSDQPKSALVSDETKEQGLSSEVRSTSNNQASTITGAQSVNNPTHGFGWFLLILGGAMMGIGLTYDPTVSSGSFGLDRTYNIGAISAKSTYTNTGGFIAVCGAIFAARSTSWKDEGRTRDLEAKK